MPALMPKHQAPISRFAAAPDVLLPGESNIGTALEGFFASLHDISNVPVEMGPRVVAMERGRAVADALTVLRALFLNSKKVS